MRNAAVQATNPEFSADNDTFSSRGTAVMLFILSVTEIPKELQFLMRSTYLETCDATNT